MKNSYFNIEWLRELMAVFFVFAGISMAQAQLDGIEWRAGMNVTKPAEGADGKPFQLRMGWNSAVSASWKIGRLSALSAGISLNRLVFTETLTVRWGSDWPFNGEFTTYETTSKLYDAGCTVMWRRSISQRLHRIAPAIGFTASRQWGPVTTLRVSGRGDDLTLDHYDLPKFNLSALLGIQCTVAKWQRNSISVMPLYAYALTPVKSTSDIGDTSTYHPHYFSLLVAFQHSL